jgi:predicted peroxiredoxin
MGRVVLVIASVGCISVLGACAAEQKGGGCRGCASHGSIMLLSITSGVDDPHAVTMALQLAGHALDDGRQVVLFFNVRGVEVPTRRLPADLAFKAEPIKALLADRIERGAEVHVCPHCMKALGIEAGDLVDGAQVTDRQKLFAKIGPNTVVFTY